MFLLSSDYLEESFLPLDYESYLADLEKYKNSSSSSKADSSSSLSPKKAAVAEAPKVTFGSAAAPPSGAPLLGAVFGAPKAKDDAAEKKVIFMLL